MSSIIKTLASTIFIIVLNVQVVPATETTQLPVTTFPSSNLTNSKNGSEPVPLYIGTLQPTSVHWWASYGRFFVDFLQWIFDDINARRDILPGYELRLMWRDTQGEAGLAARQMFELLTQGPPLLALCGVGLSDELVMVGNVAQYYNLPLLSFSAQTSNSLSRDGFQSVYITNYQGEAANRPFLAILEHFGWTRVSTIIYKDNMFETQMGNFHSLLSSRNMTLVTSAIISDLAYAADSLTRLKQFGARIIVGAFRATHAPYIFCQAYKHGLFGPSYAWLLTGAGMYDGWLDRHYSKDESVWAPCTLDQVREASRGYLAVDNVYVRPDQDVLTVAGITANEYVERVAAFSARSINTKSRSSPYAFDAAWALALTLNRTQSKLSQGALNDTRLEDFDYSREDMFNLNLESLQEISFQGVSGPVSFLPSGRRLGPHLITRYDGDTKSVVGYVRSDYSLTWTMSDQELFYGNSPPRDRVVYENRLLPPSKTAIAIVLVINCLGITADLAFLTFNILYRKNSHIKMSSPVINNVIVLGGLLMYIFVFVLTADYANWCGVYNSTVCSVRVCLACLGFTVAFGALFSKTWRVHALFTHNQMKRKVIKDSKLLSLVLVLVLADLVILVLWTIINPLTKIEYEQEAEEESTVDRRVTYKHTTCSHSNEIYWFMSEYIFKGLLLVFGAFLAWETRKVTIPALNDSKLIGFCIYNIAVICALAVPVVHVVGQDRPTLTFLLVGLFVSLCTTLVLCILFIPKVRLRNKVSERRFVSSLHASQPGDPNYNSHSQAHSNVAPSLEPRNGQCNGSGRNGLVTLTANSVLADTHSNMVALTVPDGSPSSRQLSTSISSVADHNEGNEMQEKNPSYHKSDQTTKEKHSHNSLQAEVTRLTALLTEELRAVAGLKSALVTESHGKLHFHKVGKDYVLFRSDLQREVAPKQEADKERQLAPVQTLYNTNEDDTNHIMESFT